MKATITSLIFLLLSLTVSSQTYKYIGIEEGLSNQKIYKIQKDARGYMWFLTHVGIDQYNGKEIKHYKLREGNRELDPLLNINWTFLDKTGTLLVTGKQGRIFRYDSGHDRFVQIYSMYNYWNKDYHAFVRYSYIDQEDNVWLCGKSAIHLFNIESGQKQRISNRLGNITCIEQITSEHFFIGTDKRIYLAKLENGNLKELSCGKLGMMDMHVHELYLHRTANKLFIGTFEKGVYIYDLNSQKIVRPEVELTDVNITRISPLNTKELLVATEGAGVHKLNIDTYETDPYIIANYGSYNEMDGNIINDVYVDNEQRIWLSNYPTGITVRNNQYTNYNWIKHSIGNRQSLVNNQVNSIIEDSDGDLWFGTSNGISLYDSKQKQWRSFLSSFNHGLKNQNRIFITLCEVSPGIIWAGGYASGIFQITKKNGNIEYLTPAQSFHLNVRADKYIRDIKKDRYGCIWSGGYYNLKCFNLKTRQGRLYPGLGSVTAIEEKDSTSMWIGTSTNLFLLDRNSGKYHEIPLPGGATYIYTLHQEDNGLLYIGTSGSGLFTYDPVKESISAHYHTGNSSLVSNSIYVILPTKDGNILMSTENGISIFSPTNRQFRNWTRGQGLMSTCFNAGSGVLRANGNTVFGSTDGALEFPPNIEMPKTGDSHMIFSDFRIFYQTVYPNDPNSPLTKDIDQIEKLNLKYMQNTFSIRVSSINYDYPSDILYTWQLEGFYDGWTTPSDEGTIRLTKTVQQENVVPVSPSAVSPHTYKDQYRQHVQNAQRILVVEDHDDLREYLSHTLSEAYQVETCTNGKEALKIIPEFKPDLVLSDIMMPEMRGDELCSAIKNNILTSHIPVILLTALNDEKNIVEGLETGADKYLIKPFNIGILKASIANILTNRALLRSKYAEMELHNDSISINYSNTLDQQFLETVKETITENLDNSGFNVESLCASQNMSRSSFYNKLKALTDQAPADYIRLIRLKRAAQLLSEGQYNISEISDMTGFNDVKYFREVFKKYYKISPSGYSKGEMKEEPTKP